MYKKTLQPYHLKKEQRNTEQVETWCLAIELIVTGLCLIFIFQKIAELATALQ